MEYFKSSIKSVLGNTAAESQLSGAEIVEKLVDRILSSTLLNDRRDACRALKALSRTHRIEVGTRGMDALRQILDIDKTDCEIIGLALDTLCNVTSPEVFQEEVELQKANHNIGEQFTEIFIKINTSVSQVLKFLEEFDFRVRWSTIKLLTNLLSNKPKDIQEIILVSPMGVSKLMDMLDDSREVIRNDALLLLIQLTKGNTNIQKIVAFENAFDRIYDVISQEGNVEGGIVVEDCLLLMINLLRGNYSNQNFFKEGSYIQRLSPMLQLSNSPSNDNSFGWNSQKIANVHCVIQVIRTLVDPSGPAQSVTSCQKIMKTCGLLQILCEILMISGVPAEILSETINSVAEVIRGNKCNQEFLANVMAPSSPPRPVIVVLLMSMVNEKQPFFLRSAVLYCFQCFLYKNTNLQKEFLKTLLPQNNENSSLTTGQLLCGGLFSTEPLSNWFSAVALSHSLIDSVNEKEQLLSVLLATNIGTPPVTLMQQCVALLQQSNNVQSKVGMLMLLCIWNSYCPHAVQHFLNIDSSIPYLIAFLSSHESNDDQYEVILQSISAFLLAICVHFNDDSVAIYTKEKLCNLIENRIGTEKFQDMIGGLTRHEAYSRSLKHPQICAKNASETLLDHEFCRMFKVLEGTVLESVLESNGFSNNKEKSNSSVTHEPAIIMQYKDVIRNQDSQIQRLTALVNSLQSEKQNLQQELCKVKYEMNSLMDQNKILRANQTNFSTEKLTNNTSSDVQFLNKEIEKYKNYISELEKKLSESSLFTRKSETISEESEIPTLVKIALQEKEKEFAVLKKDQEDLLELLTDQDKKLTFYREKLISLGEKIDSDDSSGEIESELAQ